VTLTVAAGYDARPTIGKIRTTVGRTPRKVGSPEQSGSFGRFD